MKIIIEAIDERGLVESWMNHFNESPLSYESEETVMKC